MADPAFVAAVRAANEHRTSTPKNPSEASGIIDASIIARETTIFNSLALDENQRLPLAAFYRLLESKGLMVTDARIHKEIARLERREAERGTAAAALTLGLVAIFGPRQELAVSSRSPAATVASQILAQVRRDAERQIVGKEQEIAAIQSRLGSVGADRQNILADQQASIARREAELRAELGTALGPSGSGSKPAGFLPNARQQPSPRSKQPSVISPAMRSRTPDSVCCWRLGEGGARASNTSSTLWSAIQTTSGQRHVCVGFSHACNRSEKVGSRENSQVTPGARFPHSLHHPHSGRRRRARAHGSNV